MSQLILKGRDFYEIESLFHKENYPGDSCKIVPCLKYYTAWEGGCEDSFWREGKSEFPAS